MTVRCSNPLEWPEGQPRTEDPEKSRLRRGTLRSALKELDSELHLLGSISSVVSCNLPLKRNGMPYAEGGLGALNQGDTKDPGVAVYFDMDTVQHVITCDRWNIVKDNILSVVDTIKCMRMIERRGSSETMKRAFSGFKALPPSTEDWRQVLGIRANTVTLDEAKRRYRALKENSISGC